VQGLYFLLVDVAFVLVALVALVGALVALVADVNFALDFTTSLAAFAVELAAAPSDFILNGVVGHGGT
jgi:ABC-type uncharacterized transport system permease subunit